MRQSVLISIISKLTLLLLTFVFGVATDRLYYCFFPPTISFCELASHANWYDGKIVYVEGIAIGISRAEEDGFILSDTNRNVPCPAAGVGFEPSYLPSYKTKNFLDDLSQRTLKRENRVGSVLVKGRVTVNKDMRGIASLPIFISANEIEPQSGATVERWPD